MRCFLLIVLCLSVGVAHAQKATDQLFKKDGTTVAAKVLEITDTSIKYKKASNPDGPTYTVAKTEVAKIIYANGETEIFQKAADSKKTAEKKTETPFGADNFVTFSNDGKYLISDLTFPDEKTYLCSWDYNSQLQSKLLFTNRRVNEPLYNWQAVADDGTYLSNGVLYDKDQKLVLAFVNPDTGKPFVDGEVKSGVISPKGNRILIKTGTGPHWLYTFDNAGKLLATRKVKGAFGASALRFSHSGDYYLFSTAYSMPGSGTVEVLDPDGNPVGTIKLQDGHTDYKYQPFNKSHGYNLKSFINFSNDDQFIIAPNSKTEVGLWDIKGTLIKLYPHFMAKVAAISRDNKTVVTAGTVPFGKEHKSDGQVYKGGQIKIWSFDGTLIKEISFPVDPTSVEFVPDNSGIVAVVEGADIWLWAKDDYALPAGADQALLDLAKSIEADRQAEKKADRASKWNAIGVGFVTGLDKMNKNMAAENLKTAKQKEFINKSVETALNDCHYAAFTRIAADDWLEVSDYFHINRACQPTLGKGIKVYYAETYEALDKQMKALIEKEAKKNYRPKAEFEDLNKVFNKAAKVGEGGCICR